MIIYFQAVAILLLSLIINDSLCQRGQRRGNGRRGNRPLRNRQRQGRVLSAQSPLGPPPQPAILLSSADPIDLIDEEVPIRQGRQQNLGRRQNFREGRQFAISGEGSNIQGNFPDEEGNYNFQ